MIKLNLQFFGGRGAGSGIGGDLGRGSEEPIDYEQVGDIMGLKGSQEQIDYRNNVMQTIKDFSDKYKDLADNIADEQIVKIKNNPSVMAFWEDGTNKLAFNRSYTDSKRMQEAYDNSIKNGYHPARGNKTAEQAVTAHELGHALTTLASIKTKMGFDAVAKDIVKTVSRSQNTAPMTMAKKVSTYATKSNAEFISESVADVYCNGRNANAFSRAIYAELKKRLK